MKTPHFYDVSSKILSSFYPDATPPLSISYERFNELKAEITEILASIASDLPVNNKYYAQYDKHRVALIFYVGVAKKPLNIDPLINWLQTYGYKSSRVSNTEDENGNFITRMEVVAMMAP